jgi:hypothetical protein
MLGFFYWSTNNAPSRAMSVAFGHLQATVARKLIEM